MKKKSIALAMGLVMTAVSVFGGNVTYSVAADEQVLPKDPVYDAATDTTDWDYVYFGNYPQTELSGEAVTEAIENASYDMYGDAVVDGERYRRLNVTSAYYSNSMVVDGFYDWTGKDYVYFKYEPVKWRVLDVEEDALFLMADSVLDCQRFAQNDNTISWEISAARKWLNGYESYAQGSMSFINMAFDAEEQAAIVTTTVEKSDNLLHGTGGGKPTEDKIFLMSIREMINEDYGFSSDFMMYSKTRQLEPTGYAHANGIWMGTHNEEYGDNCWWLLRSTGAHYKAVSLVYRYGNVYQDGYYADTPYYGICPALKVDIDSTEWTLVEESKEQSDTNTEKEEAAEQTELKIQGMSVLEQADTMAPIVWGDADADKEVTLADAQIILKVALKIVDYAKTHEYCDVDGKEGITLADAQLILKYALRIIDEFPDAVMPETSMSPVTTGNPDETTKPAVTAEPVTSIEPSNSPTRPVLPSEDAGQSRPQQSDGPLVQEEYDASGTMWIAADSIAVEYKSDKAMGLCGWGEVLDEYFNSEVTIQNMAIGGRSSKSFTTESNYNTIKKGMQPGDYLLISFGHNDERAALELYTDPYGDSSTVHSYKWYLKNYYIDPAIRAGAQPVLISPVARRYFYKGEFINPQLHTPYAQAMKELAEEYAEMGITVYYIDLHSKMLDLYEELGEDGTYSLHAENDTTHLCRAGIDIVCDYMVEEMTKQNMNIISFLK